MTLLERGDVLEGSEGGFTMIELLLSILIVSVGLLSFAMIVSSNSKLDLEVKKLHFAEDLISNYIIYLEEVDINRGNISDRVNESGRVDLVDRYGGSFPKGMRVEVVCDTVVEIIDIDKFMRFSVTCEVDNKKINRGIPYEIKRYIHNN